MNLQGRTVLVLGLGETGLSMAKWLFRRGALVRAADTRNEPPGVKAFNSTLPQAEVFAGSLAARAFSGVDLIAISPGLSLSEPLVQQALKEGTPVVGDMELFAWAVRDAGICRPKLIGITGSNGKTTVTAMTGAMLKKAGWDVEVAGNIGPAVLDALMRREDAGKMPEAWVLELSSFQLETTESLGLDAAAVLNVSEDHLDRYAGMQEYAGAKARIFLDGSNETGAGGRGDSRRVQILNGDDPLVRQMALAGRPPITFSLGMPQSDRDFGLLCEGGDTWLMQGNTRLMKTSELAITGRHNCANALAALALCRALAIPFDPLLQALREFRGLPHRVEKVAAFSGITFYDDSKGTNVGATVAALKGLGQPVVLIAGGDGKAQNFSPLAAPIGEHGRAVVVIGRDAEKIAVAINACGVPLHRAQTMEEAVRKSFQLARKGDAVLMSPACASFDMFDNYVHRAEVFVAAVKSIHATCAGGNSAAVAGWH
jgi:UDP-N-acetylmuramoylalanine--D-glutamate ligase